MIYDVFLSSHSWYDSYHKNLIIVSMCSMQKDSVITSSILEMTQS